MVKWLANYFLDHIKFWEKSKNFVLPLLRATRSDKDTGKKVEEGLRTFPDGVD